MTHVAIPEALLACMRTHAAQSPAIEVCGLLGARRGVPTGCYPVANAAPNPASRFDMDVRGQIDAMRTMRERGEALFAIYHSHPRGPSAPSAVDLREAAYPQALYLILSPGRAGFQVHAWRLAGPRFVPVELIAEP
ncbi:MAG: M67 family metallopeptidase [Gammaproteobacteria bacterium]